MGIKREVLRNQMRFIAKKKGYRRPNKYVNFLWHKKVEHDRKRKTNSEEV